MRDSFINIHNYIPHSIVQFIFKEDYTDQYALP